MAARAIKNRRKNVRKARETEPKSTKNRRKIAFGLFWASKAVSGTRRGAFGTRPGRAKAGPRAILGRPERPKSGRETPKSEPGTVPRRSLARPERCRSACDAAGTVGCVIGAIFHRFCLGARKLRCAKNVAPANVLYTSQEVNIACARAAKKLENVGVSAFKIKPRSVRATQNRARAARFARQNAKKSREAHRFFWKAGANMPTERARAAFLAAKSARVPNTTGAGTTRTLGTRCGLPDRTCKALVRKLGGGS